MSDYIRNRARLFVLIVAIRYEEPYAHRVVAISAERYQGIQHQPLIPFGNPMAPFDAPQWHVRAFRVSLPIQFSLVVLWGRARANQVDLTLKTG